MRRMRSLLSPFAVVSLALAAQPAVAQQLAVASIHASPSTTVTGDDPVVRPVAIYSFEGARAADMPSQVTVSDSLGTIVGSYRVRGSNVVRTMNAEVEGNEVFLQAATASGTLTLVIYQLGERDRATAVIGHWMLGGKQGELLRRASR